MSTTQTETTGQEPAQIPPKRKMESGPKKFFLILASVLLLFILYGVFGNKAGNSDPSLKANMSFTGTQFVITNLDEMNWTDVKIEVNEEFTLNVDLIEAGNIYTVGAGQFAKEDGTRFNPFTMKPRKLSIIAKEGMYFGEWK